jgi:carboxypeptidase C (cathepsin A)
MIITTRVLWITTLLSLLLDLSAVAAGPLRSHDPSADAAAGTAKKKPKEAEKPDEDVEEEPKLSVTDHLAQVEGKKIAYKATAGYMVMRDFQEKTRAADDSKDEKGEKPKKKGKKPKTLAKIFVVSYTSGDPKYAAKRPLTFCFNGGPGSASIWLHMGAIGPKRAHLTDQGEAPPPPYGTEENPNTWLDATDLVFIDPVSTGFSRAESDEDPQKFHGFDEDIQSVAEFIRLYITKNGRWASPKFVVGESYGTTRACGLAEYLQNRYGIYLNGIGLVSAVLNWATLDFATGNDLPYILYVPGYAASAWYHKRLSPALQALPVTEVMKRAEEFAAHDYQQALFAGDTSGSAKKKEIAARLSEFTGLPAPYLEQLNLRIPDEVFFSRLLSDQNRLIGRYDSRYSSIRYTPGREQYEFDPSYEAVFGPFTVAINDYMRRELAYESELPYEALTDVEPWRFKNAQNRYLNVAEDLRKAMIRNPYLKVWLCGGRFDLACPPFAVQYTLNQMDLDSSIKGNIRFDHYDAGHMMYLYKPALIQLKSDFKAFLTGALLPDSASVPSTRR